MPVHSSFTFLLKTAASAKTPLYEAFWSKFRTAPLKAPM